MKWQKAANLITLSRIALCIPFYFAPVFTLPYYAFFLGCGLTDMLDGMVARKAPTSSRTGALLDSLADFLFALVCFIKLFPVFTLPLWAWLWVAGIACIKLVNLVSGYVYHHRFVMLHTAANKATGLLLFILLLGFPYVQIQYLAIPGCLVATFAAVQEGHLIRTGHKMC